MLTEQIFTPFENDKELESYSELVLFMMALDMYNVSLQRDMVGAQVKFNNLMLDSFPGDDVTELAMEAL